MIDKQQRARELLAAEYAARGLQHEAMNLRDELPFLPVEQQIALDAIAAALPDEQLAEGSMDDLIERLRAWSKYSYHEMHQEKARALYGEAADTILRLLAPPAGPAVEELLADMRERAAAKCLELLSWIGGLPAGSVKGALNDAATAIRALPLTTESQNG